MAIELASAISAYKSAVGRVAEGDSPGLGGIGGAGNNSANDFSTMVKNFAQNAVNKSEMSEQLSAAAAAGKANIDQVVIAVAEAETTLTTVVAVRDKVLEAYREILRMPI
jgi:flagellar hook-basal body complex protein FliE